MSENDKTDTKEENSVSTVSRMDKRMGEKKSEMFQQPLLITAMVHKRLERGTCLLNDLKNHENRMFIFSDEKTFTDDLVLNKLNDRVVTFVKDVSKHHKVSTTKHPASIRLLDVVASNGEEMPQAWFERGYRLCRLQRRFGDETSSMGQEDH